MLITFLLRNGRFALVLLILATLCLLFPLSTLAVPPPTLEQADELYRLDKLLTAEHAYREVLRGASNEIARQHCYDRLLSIYARVGRQDQAIQVALEYENWAERSGKAQQARELNLALGGWYLALGHYGKAEKHLGRALQDRRGATLTPARKVTALTYLALVAEKRGDRDGAGRAWREVERFASSLLDGPRQDLTPQQRIDCVRSLAESYRFEGKPEAAIPRLRELLPLHDRLKDPAGRRDTLRLLADHLLAARRLADAESCLRQAIQQVEQGQTSDRLVHADLASALADVLERRGQTGDARSWREQAIEAYRAVQADGRGGQIGRAGVLTAFWKLQTLYQRSGQLDRALALTQDLGQQWRGEILVEYRLKAEQGSLQVVLGKFEESRMLMREAVGDLEKQSPANLVELPRALLNLAVVELVMGGQGRAVKQGRQVLDLYHDNKLPDDLVLVEAYNLLGTCATQDGDYAQAIDDFREGVKRCDRLGQAAAPQQSHLLLNMALAHKAQGNLAEALVNCRKAEAAQRRFADPDPLALAALRAAQASLLAAQGKFEQAKGLSDEVLELCEKKPVRGRATARFLVIVARHCQALFHLDGGNFARAEETWLSVQKLQGAHSPLLPRTLNYRGLTRERQGQLGKAETLYREALKLQKENPRAFPVTHFATLWRLANVVDRQEHHAEARALLGEAVAVVERARGRVYGEASQRAAFFAQFEPGFDQLVEWSIRDGDPKAAVAVAARARSRTLLDQLLLAVDPRQGLSRSAGGELLQQEEALRREIATLRAQARLLSPAALASKEAQDLLTKFDRAQQKYAEVYRDILNANRVYRSLSQPEFTAADLASLRDRVLGQKKLLLVYYIGREQSYLLLLGGRQTAAEAFPLMVPGEVAERVTSPKPLTLVDTQVRARGGRPSRAQPQSALPLQRPTERPPPPGSADGTPVPLTRPVLRALVDTYLQQVAGPGFDPTRTLVHESRDPARPLPAQRPELLADILLPLRVRQRIREEAPQCLLIVPDGALHKLPFEALLLRAKPTPTYALDELPPLVYAPSVALLAMLNKPAAGPRPGSLSLLTIAPAYPETKAPPPDAKASPRWALLGVRSELRRLENAELESRRISRLFPADQVTALRGEQATEKAVVAALPGKRILHLAAHGFADSRFGNKFGALALTPPPDRETAERIDEANDGFWSLHELSSLRLPECELAVLSACQTNVGPEQPLEGGVTLAGGFLAAGARRVVASHWSVSDRSTADLMEAFFQEVTTAARRGQPVFYPAALQKAQRSVRKQARWEEPFYWAPFVLVGAAD